MVKRLILLFLIFFSLDVYSQRINPDIIKDRMIDSLIRSNRVKYGIMTSNRVLTFKRIGFKIRTTLNSSVLSKIDVNKFESELTTNIGEAFEDIFTSLDKDDYISILAYDLRGKIYINKQIKLTGRVYIAGVQYGNNTYFIGFDYTF